MPGVTIQVMATVNGPYGTNLSAHQLAKMIADPKSVKECNACVFAFFSEVSAPVQMQFVKDMGVDAGEASKVATQLSKISGYALPLAV